MGVVIQVPADEVRVAAARTRGAAEALSGALDGVLGAGATAGHALGGTAGEELAAVLGEVTSAVDAVVVSWRRLAEGYDAAVDALVEQDQRLGRAGGAR